MGRGRKRTDRGAVCVCGEAVRGTRGAGRRKEFVRRCLINTYVGAADTRVDLVHAVADQLGRCLISTSL